MPVCGASEKISDAPVFCIRIIEKRAPICYNFSMNYVRLKSYAKINLTLDITGADGGFHNIDSLVASVDIYDLIAVKKRKDKLVSVTMHGRGSEAIAFEDNNAVKAAELFIKTFSVGGVDITVWKNIPVGAGLGGSSADVAGVIKAMCALYEVPLAKGKEVADKVGSDCGYMLYGGFARLSGRGDRVKLLDSDLKLDIGLIIPKTGVSTAECYRLYDSAGGGCPHCTEEAEEAVKNNDFDRMCKSLNNHLMPAAMRLNGDIAGAIKTLMGFDPPAVNMTGSGSGVYALFENDQFAQYAKSRIRGAHEFILTKTVKPEREDI